LILKNAKFLVILLALGFFISGCATVPSSPPLDQTKLSGIYHQVEKGETLWGISKAYNIDINTIVKANKLPDPTKINKGQKLFIPGRQAVPSILHTKNEPMPSENFIWPIKGKVLSYFNSTKESIRNKGIDIAAKEGDSFVAAGSGKVIFCNEKVKGYGKTIILDHGNGFTTLYANSSEIFVKSGQLIKRNDAIGRIGKTGRAETASLHFEIRYNEQTKDPLSYLP